MNFLKVDQIHLQYVLAYVEGEQKKSAQTFYFIPQKWLILGSKVKLEVKTMGQEL